MPTSFMPGRLAGLSRDHSPWEEPFGKQSRERSGSGRKDGAADGENEHVKGDERSDPSVETRGRAQTGEDQRELAPAQDGHGEVRGPSGAETVQPGRRQSADRVQHEGDGDSDGNGNEDRR